MTDSSALARKLHAAWDFRKAYLRRNEVEAFRLVHGEGDGLKGLFIDVYGGDFLIVFREPFWLKKQAELKKALLSLSELGRAETQLFFASNFPSAPSKAAFPPPREGAKVINVKEGDLAFEVHLGEGLHTGLFLDQRENRRWVRSFSQGKRVLNLFSYTGAFTVAALRGGARETVSVDLSKNSLNWLQRNVELNTLDLNRSHIHALDVYEFLKKAERKDERFDLILLDPPTFSRGRKKTFSTERDLEALVGLTARRLAKGGELFVSVNTQNLKPQQFQEEVYRAVEPLQLKILQPFSLPQDFRLSPAEKKNPHLKSCRVG